MTIPHKTRRAWHANNHRFHPTAKALDVNVKYVHELITKGKEPTGREVRIKMGFSPKPRQVRSPKPAIPDPEPPESVQWWRKLDKQTRREWIESAYNASRGL